VINDTVYLIDFLPFQKKLAFYGVYYSLAQLVLKVTCPGVPDFFQGNETWRFDLVDPDNRQRIDYHVLKNLHSDEPLEDLLVQWHTGKIKFNLTKQLLKFRAEHHELFSFGDYKPLIVQGENANHIIAFSRCYHHDWLIVIVARYIVSMLPINAPWSVVAIPNQDCLLLPQSFKALRSVFGPKHAIYSGDSLSIREVLCQLPFAILTCA